MTTLDQLFTSKSGGVNLTRQGLYDRGHDSATGWDDAKMQSFVDIIEFKMMATGVIRKGEKVPAAGRTKNSWRRIAFLMYLDSLAGAM